MLFGEQTGRILSVPTLQPFVRHSAMLRLTKRDFLRR